MFFNTVRYRCVKCRRRLTSNESECSCCKWRVDQDSAKLMAQMVARHRRAVFWVQIKEILLGRKKTEFFFYSRGKSVQGNRAISHLAIKLVVINLMICAMLFVNILERSYWMPRQSTSAALQSHCEYYGWPFIALKTVSEVASPTQLSSSEIVAERKDWSAQNFALNVLVLFSLVLISWHIMNFFHVNE